MRALRFEFSLPRYAIGRTAGRYSDAAVFGWPSGLRLQQAPPPQLLGPSWARLEVIASGICGTDLATLTYALSPALEPFGSFPAVLGHEILARVVEIGPAVRRVRLGQRVVVDPLISCTVRDGAPAQEQCAPCSTGRPACCLRAGERGRLQVEGRDLARGLTVGFHSDLPGGWGEQLVAHETQLYPVDEALDDRTAVLVEPLSIGVHAVLSAPPEPASDVLVRGTRPIALGAIWALRALGHVGELVAQTKRQAEAELALALGASKSVMPGDAVRGELLRRGGRVYRPPIGPEVHVGGGFPTVFDCVGSRNSLYQAMRFASPGGRVIMLGCAGVLSRLDLTFLWARELELRGFVGYGIEQWRGEARHTFEVTQTLLREHGSAAANMVTHVFPLEQFRQALVTARHRARSGAIKVLLTPGNAQGGCTKL